jgi:threonine dehydratase
MSTPLPVTLADVAAARNRLRDALFVSPCRRSKLLSEQFGGEIYLKLDNLQVTGSFKERGAANRLLLLSEEERARGIIAASAGNHAQALAYHGTRLGINAKIYMPEGTPLVKISRTKRFGAEVVLKGENFDASYAAAREAWKLEGRVFIHPFDDAAVIAGQGTLGLELIDQVPDLDTVVIPVGGGGLAAGVAVAIKAMRPQVRVIGVEPVSIPSLTRALQTGHPVEVPDGQTLADGIAVRKVGDLTCALLRAYCDEVVTVTEDDLASAILVLLEQEKTLAEAAGAAGMAAVLGGRIETAGKRTVVVLSGGNIDVNLLSRIIDRGLAATGRISRLSVRLKDTPGTLAALLSLLGRLRANVLEVVHNRTFLSGGQFGSTDVELKLETRGEDHILEIHRALGAEGYAVLHPRAPVA